MAQPPSFHTEPIEKLLDRLGVEDSLGLSGNKAAETLARVGKNRLPQAPKASALAQFIEQFKNPLVLTLLGAAAVAVVVGATAGGDEGFLERYGDALAILLIVVLNAALGFFQERRAEAALEALQKMAAPSAKVRRDGKLCQVAAEDVVPGDILELEAGDAIAADARLLQAADLAIEEAALTGESVPSTKDAKAIIEANAPMADRTNMIFLGTNVVRGKGRAVVVATGAGTELGKIGKALAETEGGETPLEAQLERFGQRILIGCLALSAVLFAWGMVRHHVIPGVQPRTWSVLLLEAVSLAVAAIPEGLPAITTITLALGTQRMAKLGAIVRKLPAVETLGAASVICSDKTGTLTQNRMMVREVWAGGESYRVEGQGYDPAGRLLRGDTPVPTGEAPEPLWHLLKTALLCNTSDLVQDAEEGWKIVGDPTEGALLVLAARGGAEADAVRSSMTIVRELPFDSDRKRMTVVTLDARGREVAHVKGSVDVLLPRCSSIEMIDGVRDLTAEDRKLVLAQAERMSSEALRVLALCRRHRPEGDPEDQLTLLGLVGMMDPPRPGVPEAIAACRDAGISVVMITGDHKLTASAIAREIGLWTEGDEAMTGDELAALDEAALAKRVERIRVFARTTAEQKLRIVNALKARRHVVAMTGDGVNDAPALRAAHIGIAMGKMGTDVARQAADLVLADDNFATIVAAIREGRAIYRNIQKFIFFLLSSNMGLCVAVFATAVSPSWIPLTPLMILWINLVTNGLPALALGIDPPSSNQMKERPRHLDDSILATRDWWGIAYVGAVMGVAALVFYARAGGAMEPARALAFTLLALSPLVHAFSCRSPAESILKLRPVLSKPLLVAVALSAAIHLVSLLVEPLRPVFKTFPLTMDEALLCGALSLLIIPAMELWKLLPRPRTA
ncbi:MAG: cation-translocating P-type ATPase [Polyangiaceae bacterium]|jgi:Ca2+-transporting ATPase|nr:cation-translocating P-type ATPase [Polyangiaceae bacterium]